METIPILKNPANLEASSIVNGYNKDKFASLKPSFNPDNLSLTAEGGKSFFSYLKILNLTREQKLLVLAPNSHYYYDENDLKGVRTLVNLRKMNMIKDLDYFLSTLFTILPMDSNFVGCFSDSKTVKWDGLFSEFSTAFNNLLDWKTYRSLDKDDVAKILGKYGFEVIDMSDMNGLTFFYAKNVSYSIPAVNDQILEQIYI